VQKTANVTFPKTGKWYEFFTRDSIVINTASQSIPLTPGEYRLYSTRKFDDPHVVTEISEFSLSTGYIRIYPNPAGSEINITAQKPIDKINIYSVTGKLMTHQINGSANQLNLNIEGFAPGVYLLKIIQSTQVLTLKFVKE
jgi:hypothetical protein